ncbi:MAG: hypothetical protein ACFFBP_09815 [Promethearchaeota archaeon]
MNLIIYLMRHNYRIHGKHCYLRSFKTNCRKCGSEVLYWECTHGSKLFFNYPPYGKLIKHYCRGITAKNKKKKYPVIVKSPNKILIKASPSCPACGKLFKSEGGVLEHLKQVKKSDNLHEFFFESKHYLQNQGIINRKPFKNRPKFGRITVKERKSDSF